MTDSDFSERLLAWHKKAGRHTLPWQQPRSAYRVWLSEIMLQQTQVATVIPYFENFIQQFPDIVSLAAAEADQVMGAWAGLGYYTRARNLHAAAKIICEQHDAVFPENYDAVLALPGIGRSTAGAILAQAFEQRHAILDGNVRRVLSRYQAVPGWPGTPAVEKKLWALAERLTPDAQIADYTQAIMDLGATVCKRLRPQCALCPLQAGCKAFAQDSVSEYPSPRPKRERPLRSVRMLILSRNENEILLVKRPSSGIWGGLWSLPEMPQDMPPQQYCREILGVDIIDLQEVTGLRHGFTHFELDIHPVRAMAGGFFAVNDDADQLWYKLATREGGQPPGMPAPVAKLLQQEFG